MSTPCGSWEGGPPPPRGPRARASLTEYAGELGCTGHEALEVHPQTAVPVAAREGLGQLVVQVEA